MSALGGGPAPETSDDYDTPLWEAVAAVYNLGPLGALNAIGLVMDAFEREAGWQFSKKVERGHEFRRLTWCLTIPVKESRGSTP